LHLSQKAVIAKQNRLITMPNISKRGESMPASPIRKLVPYAEAAKQKGRVIYQLNIGQPDIKTPPSALEAVRHTNMEVLAYSHSAGNESYRRKLVGYYEQLGAEGLDHNNFIIATGASEALAFTMMACLDAGDEIIVPEPFYANYNGFSTAGDIVIKPITARIEDGFALPPMQDFERLVTPKTKAILICNPSNPTGYLYSEEELEVLKNIVKKHDLFLFVDEVYREFCYDGRSFLSALCLEGIEQNVVVFDSISKRFSACGARIGMVVSRNKDVLAAVMKFAQARLSPPSLAQIVGEATLDVPKSYIEEAIAEYDRRRRVLVERLNRMEGVVCPTPGGAFYAFVKLPVDSTERFCKWLLESFEHEGQTVMLAPGEGFYATKGLGGQEARIAYVLNVAELHKAMDCLEAALRAYNMG
jgi:aspartate aminotransferase